MLVDERKLMRVCEIRTALKAVPSDKRASYTPVLPLSSRPVSSPVTNDLRFSGASARIRLLLAFSALWGGLTALPYPAVTLKQVDPKVRQERMAQDDLALFKELYQLKAEYKTIYKAYSANLDKRQQAEKVLRNYLKLQPETLKALHVQAEKAQVLFSPDLPAEALMSETVFQALPEAARQDQRLVRWRKLYASLEEEARELYPTVDSRFKAYARFIGVNQSALVHAINRNRVEPPVANPKNPLPDNVRTMAATLQQDSVIQDGFTGSNMAMRQFIRALSLTESMNSAYNALDEMPLRLQTYSPEIQKPISTLRSDPAWKLHWQKRHNADPSVTRIAILIPTEGNDALEEMNFADQMTQLKTALTDPKTGYRVDSVILPPPAQKEDGIVLFPSFEGRVNRAFAQACQERDRILAERPGQKVEFFVAWMGHGGVDTKGRPTPQDPDSLDFYRQGTGDFVLGLNRWESLPPKKRHALLASLGGPTFELLIACHAGAGICKQVESPCKPDASRLT